MQGNIADAGQSHIDQHQDARSEGLVRIEGVVPADNERMLAMCREFGFRLERHPEEPGAMRAVLDLASRNERDCPA